MRPNIETGIEQTGNLGTLERTKASIDQNSLAYLMSMLSNLYTDAVGATIREPATNGMDAHIAAGNSDPIEVFLPNAFDSTYIVKDRGVGMSKHEVLNLYSQYGYSSKRDNDEESGMMGLGCKAPLAYTDQFTVVATKDGMQTIVLIAKNANDGIADFVVMSEEETDEPNGVEVRIPVRDRSGFNETAMRFFSNWSPGQVLVDGKDPSIFLLDDYTRLDDDIIAKPSQSTWNSGHLTIVMGNISYKVDRARTTESLQRTGMNYIVRVPMGSVNFPPNREELQYTDRTLETIKSTVTFIMERLQTTAQGEVDKAATKADAYPIIAKWQDTLSERLLYKGEKAPHRFALPEGSFIVHRDAVESREFFMDPFRHNNTRFVPHHVVVFNHGNKTVPTRNRDKLRRASEALKLDTDRSIRYIMVPDDKLPFDGWIKTSTLDWNEVRKIRIPRNGSPVASEAPTYPVYHEKLSRRVHFTLEELVAFVTKHNLTVVRTSLTYDVPPVMRQWLPNYIFIPLAENRVAKLDRSVPRVATMTEAQNDLWERMWHGLTPDALMRHALSEEVRGYRHQWLQKLQGHRAALLDPRVQEVMTEAATVTKEERRLIQEMKSVFQWKKAFDVASDSVARIEEVESCYPLVDEVSYRTEPEHVVEYINAVYLMKQEA